MLVEPAGYEALFQELRADLQATDERKILVFVSTAEADSVCAVRTLQLLLMTSGLHFSTYPVSTTSEIASICEAQVTGEVQCVMLVNCGAADDLVELMRLREDSETRVIVADSHRPMHHNAPRLARVSYLVAEDEAARLAADMPPADEASGSDNDEPEERGDRGEGTSDSEDKENDRPAQRQRVSPDGAHAGVPSRARRRQRRDAARAARREYYARGACWGRPAACTLLDLARQLHMDDRHFLWLAICGLTDQHLHQRIGAAEYAAAVRGLETLVDQMGEEDEGGGEGDTEQVPVEDQHGNVTLVRRRRIAFGTITAVDDFRFPLMRHWSVYDAIIHSRYVAVRLGTWQEKGRQKVDELLCRMGFSQRDAKQDYCVTSRKFANLAAKLADHAHNYRLPDLRFRSFRQAWGSNAPLYAADVVYAATALLEAPPSMRPGEAGPRDDKSDQFWKSWNCLAVRDSGELQQGIELSKRLQRAILSDGGLLIASKAGQERKRFRWFDMTRNEVSHKAILGHPLALVKLGMFLRDVAAVRAPAANRAKPIVLVGPADAAGSCLVVAVTAEPFHAPAAAAQQQDGQRACGGNTFGPMFQRAAENVGATYRADGFDSSVIELGAADVDRFIRELSVLATSSVYAARGPPSQPQP